MTAHIYGDDVMKLLDDALARGVPRPLYLALRPGDAPDGTRGWHLVATWKHGPDVYVAWKPVSTNQDEQLAHRQLWAAQATLRGLLTRGGVADARAWPIPKEWKSVRGAEPPTGAAVGG